MLLKLSTKVFEGLEDMTLGFQRVHGAVLSVVIYECNPHGIPFPQNCLKRTHIGVNHLARLGGTVVRPRGERQTMHLALDTHWTLLNLDFIELGWVDVERLEKRFQRFDTYMIEDMMPVI